MAASRRPGGVPSPDAILDALTVAEQRYSAACAAAELKVEPLRLARNDALVRAVQGGASRYRLAKLLGVSWNSISQIALDPPRVAPSSDLERLQREAIAAHERYRTALEVAEKNVEPARKARNALIVEAAQTLPIVQIGRVLGVSRQRVYQVLGKAPVLRPRAGTRQRRLRARDR